LRAGGTRRAHFELPCAGEGVLVCDPPRPAYEAHSTVARIVDLNSGTAQHTASTEINRLDNQWRESTGCAGRVRTYASIPKDPRDEATVGRAGWRETCRRHKWHADVARCDVARSDVARCDVARCDMQRDRDCARARA
jgi:hypothetical protein